MNVSLVLTIIFFTKRYLMAKWDSEKLEKEIKKAADDKTEAAVPVRTPKLSKEETLRRYDRG